MNKKKLRLQRSRLSKHLNYPRAHSLEPDDHTWRALIESMNQGVLTMTSEGVILFANKSLARMVKRPIKQVTGCSFYRFLSAADQASLRLFLNRAKRPGFTMNAILCAGDDLQVPVKISARALAKDTPQTTTFCLTVTDVTEAHQILHVQRDLDLLRNLMRHVTQAQEVERKWVTNQFHRNVSQLAYVILVRCGTLARNLPKRENASRVELMKLCELTTQMIESSRHISRNLRPSALDDLGLVPVLRADCEEFGKRTHIRLNMDGVRMIGRLSAEVETALYRIFQMVLNNVQQHAHARHVTVDLTRRGAFVELAIKDDGVGFDQNQPPARRKEGSGFGLASMRERATCVGGALSVKSTPRNGTEIQVRIPLQFRMPFARAKNARFHENHDKFRTMAN